METSYFVQFNTDYMQEAICGSRNSKSQNQHGFKTMHRTLDSIRLPLVDILSLLMTSGGQKRAMKSGGSFTVHRKILTVGTKGKHPNKQASEPVNRKNT